MCSICGIVSESLKPESSYWRKMCEYITESKKDAFQQNGCTISSECDFYVKNVAGSKCFVSVSGKILNYEKIRQNLELRGMVFDGESYSELVLLSYFAFGKSVFKIYHGEFAIVMWDGYEKELILARDKMGFKQLFYYYDSQRVVFSTTIKGILKFPFVKKELRDDIFCRLFTLSGNSYTTDTLFDKIYEIPPGGVAIYKDRKITNDCYSFFQLNNANDSFKQTLSGFKYLIKGNSHSEMTEEVMNENEIYDKLKEFVDRYDRPSPYIDLNDLSNLGSKECFVNNISVFSVPGRFKLPIKSCERGDKEFLNGFLSTLPSFPYKDEKDIVKKEEMFIKLSIVLPQVITAKKTACENMVFPFLTDEVIDYSLKSLKYGEKLLNTCFKAPKVRPLKENLKALKLLFLKKVTDSDFMLGIIKKDEILKFTRLFPRPETMMYLLQTDIWLNKFL